MKLTLKSGKVISDGSCDVFQWKQVLKDPDMVVTYSTDTDGVILFRSSEIADIWFDAKDVERSLHETS